MAPDFVRYNPQDSHVRSVRYDPCGFFFRVMHPNIAFLGECKRKAKCKHTQQTLRIWRLTLQTKPLTEWLFVCSYMHSVRDILIQALTRTKTEREEQRRRGRERRAPDECTKLRVRCDFFCTNATSGIMRRRHLMCESRVLPCPQGSAEWQKGETREEGGHALDMFALTNITCQRQI